MHQTLAGWTADGGRRGRRYRRGSTRLPMMLAALSLVAPWAPLAEAGTEPAPVFATELACEKDHRFGPAVCRRAFQVAHAVFESSTRSYPNRFGCLRAYGPCMPWPVGAGSAARFRPQLMSVSLTGAGATAAAVPIVAPGRIKLALVPRLLSAALTDPPEGSASLPIPAGPPGASAVALCRHIEAVASKEHLPAGFLARLIWQESSFRAHVVSPAGALGIAQFMPGTAQERGLADPFDPLAAIQSSAALLGELARQFGNLGLAAAAYNGGPARVSGWLQGRRTLAPETERYVLRITGRTVREWAATGSIDAASLPATACLEVAARAGPIDLPEPASADLPQPSIGSLTPTMPLASSARAR